MDVTTITMPPEQALEKLRAFRADKHKDAEAEYRAAAAGYEALAAGLPLILLTESILAAGFDAQHRPKLAVARADRKEVEYFAYWERRGTFDSGTHGYRRSPGMVREISPLPEEHAKAKRGYAMVPMVPADVRPKVGQLKNWFVLWEVEEWTEHRRTVPPRDPILLKQIHGDLYAVLAAWDLTEIERAVMTGRRPQ